MKQQLNIPHWKDGGLDKQDIIFFIDDYFKLSWIKSQLKRNFMFSSNVIDGIYKYFEIVRVRLPWKIDANWETEKLKKILSMSEYSSESDLLAYLDNLCKFASWKTVNWEYIFPWNSVNLLADYKNREKNWLSKKKRLQLKKLVSAIESWKLPISVLYDFRDRDDNSKILTSLISDCSEINPLILNDIENFSTEKWDGSSLYIPEYDSLTSFYTNWLINYLKPGSLVSFKHWNGHNNKEVYIVPFDKTHPLHWPLKVDRETLFKIFSPVLRYFIKQWWSGTCYQLSWYISMMQDPHFYSRVLQRLEKCGDDVVITLPQNFTDKNIFKWKSKEFDKHWHLYTKLDENWEFVAVDERQSVKSNWLYRALEHLLWKYRKFERAEKFVNQYKWKVPNWEKFCADILNDIDSTVYEFENGKWVGYPLSTINQKQIANTKKWHKPKIFKSVEDYYKEWWNSFDILDMFTDYNSSRFKNNPQFNSKILWDDYWSYWKVDANTLNILRNMLKKTDFIKTFWTIEHKLEGEHLLSGKDWLFSSHAYSILDYDPKTDVVKYINPRNSVFVFKMKLSELAKYIRHVSIKKFV